MEDIKYHRSKLIEHFVVEFGATSWIHYWNTVRSFIIGKISKEELDIVVNKYLLNPDKGW